MKPIDPVLDELITYETGLQPGQQPARNPISGIMLAQNTVTKSIPAEEQPAKAGAGTEKKSGEAAKPPAKPAEKPAKPKPIDSYKLFNESYAKVKKLLLDPPAPATVQPSELKKLSDKDLLVTLMLAEGRGHSPTAIAAAVTAKNRSKYFNKSLYKVVLDKKSPYYAMHDTNKDKAYAMRTLKAAKPFVEMAGHILKGDAKLPDIVRYAELFYNGDAAHKPGWDWSKLVFNGCLDGVCYARFRRKGETGDNVIPPEVLEERKKQAERKKKAGKKKAGKKKAGAKQKKAGTKKQAGAGQPKPDTFKGQTKYRAPNIIAH